MTPRPSNRATQLSTTQMGSAFPSEVLLSRTIAQLVQQLEEAQRVERQLWSAMPERGADMLSLASAADEAWVQLRTSAAAFVAQPASGWLGREQRLAAGLLLSLLNASEPEQVDRLQAMARAISDDKRPGTRGDVRRILALISRGPFPLSPASLGLSDMDDAEEHLAPVWAA